MFLPAIFLNGYFINKSIDYIYIYKEKIQRSMEFAKINCLHVYIYYCREYNNNYKIIAYDNFYPFLHCGIKA
jgi:hypothetical protein